MSITYQMFQKASFYLEKYDRETFLADTGQRSRAIIPGDDPGDQQPPERRGFYPDPHAVAANASLAPRGDRQQAGSPKLCRMIDLKSVSDATDDGASMTEIAEPSSDDKPLVALWSGKVLRLRRATITRP